MEQQSLAQKLKEKWNDEESVSGFLRFYDVSGYVRLQQRHPNEDRICGKLLHQLQRNDGWQRHVSIAMELLYEPQFEDIFRG
jgi:hypothetical protein